MRVSGLGLRVAKHPVWLPLEHLTSALGSLTLHLLLLSRELWRYIVPQKVYRGGVQYCTYFSSITPAENVARTPLITVG